MTISTCVLLSLNLALVGQPPPVSKAKGAAPVPPSSGFEVELGDAGQVVRAQARNAPLGEVAKRLEAVLKVKVQISSSLVKSRVTFPKIEAAPLGDLLNRLAPVVYVDSRESWAQPPVILAIHLRASDEAAPAVHENVGLVIEGIAEDPIEDGDSTASIEVIPSRPAKAQAAKPEATPDDAPFLRVERLETGRMNLDARDKGLGVLLFEVAQAFGAPFDLRIPEAPVVGRINVNGILPSELPGVLGIPGVGAEVRRNLLTGEEVLLRYFVDPAF